MALTHFLSAILQAQGNTKTPLYVMTLAGVLNVGMNLFFVLVVGLSVEGVAIATAIANLVSACILWTYLARRGGDCCVSMRKLRIHGKQCAEIARVGFPSGIQTSLFSLSNILIQSSVLQVNNAITPVGSAYAPVMRGDAAVGSLETFVFTALSAVTVAASTFTAQNVGANNYARVRRAVGYVLMIAVSIGAAMSILGMLAREPLVALYGVRDGGDILSTIALDTSWKRMIWKWPAFFIYAIMNTCAGTIRGMGKSTLAALITFFGTCVFRIVWIYTVFRYFESLEAIYISYPISWFLTGVCFLITVFVMLRKKLSTVDPAQAV
jgi:Na+-driven multidrug efflux pump